MQKKLPEFRLRQFSSAWATYGYKVIDCYMTGQGYEELKGFFTDEVIIFF